MRELKLKPEITEIEYPDDINLLRAVLKENDYTANDHDIQKAWQLASESVCAGWLIVETYDNETVLYKLLNYLVPVEEDE